MEFDVLLVALGAVGAARALRLVGEIVAKRVGGTKEDGDLVVSSAGFSLILKPHKDPDRPVAAAASGSPHDRKL